ncbi:MAG: hypothetical protein QM780_05950 [Hyphomicrobium sp.]|uniref:hypothetical protein n=1 Tax=Hyphomicrobium sp. TaxID=82 RepID=UPI0039E6A81D
MDLKAARQQNVIADRLTRAGMLICFLATGTLLVGTLAFDALHDPSGPKFPFSKVFNSR